MIEYPAVQTLNIISGCDHYEVSAGQKSEPDQFPGEKELAEIREFVEGIRRLAAQLNLETLKSRALLFLNNIFKAQTHRGPLHWAVVKNEMSSMRSTFVARLCAQKFAFIPADKAKYFEQEDAFGEVGKPFKPLASDEINAEIKAAGNCLAADLNTAAVFHAIRAAEMGMRRLASRLKVIVYRDGKRIKIIEATWNELIKEINNTIDAEKQKPKAARKIKGHFRDYEILADHLNILKDTRNDVMHSHGGYKASEALGVFERVSDFMQRLAKRISLK